MDINRIRHKLHEIIFEAETPAGKAFDIVLIGCVTLSVLCVILESVTSVQLKYGDILYKLEWFFTVLFTVEYFLRIWILQRPRSYIFSFFGIVDLLAIIPTYASFFFPGAQSLLAIRALRLLRVFRILKLTRYTAASQLLLTAMIQSRAKITVFLLTVVNVIIIVGSLMYFIEGRENGFTSIPVSIYWAVVTMTTVGFGDIVPKTEIGQFISALLMIFGYGIIAVPTGIVTAELASASKTMRLTRTCLHCAKEGHDAEASYCDMCGGHLESYHKT